MNLSLYARLLERLETGLELLPDKPEETPESTLHALWLLACGEPLSAEAALERSLPPLDEAGARTLQKLVERRLQGEPLSHITGRQRFMGHEMLTSADALIPRKETELLAVQACSLIERLARQQEEVRVIDVCTGAGNLPIAFAMASDRARVHCADLCPNAVDLARRNIARFGIQQQVDVVQGDLLEPFDNEHYLGKIDVMTCNPPYIYSAKVKQMPEEISQYEPRLAFDGGAFGIKILERLIKQAPRFLKPGGHLMFEVGEGQGEGYVQRLRKKGLYSGIKPLSPSEDAPIRAIWVTL